MTKAKVKTKVKTETPKSKTVKQPEINKKIEKISEEVLEKVNWLKSKYEEIDPKTKKKLAIGLGAAAAGLITLIGVKKSIKKK